MPEKIRMSVAENAMRIFGERGFPSDPPSRVVLGIDRSSIVQAGPVHEVPNLREPADPPKGDSHLSEGRASLNSLLLADRLLTAPQGGVRRALVVDVERLLRPDDL